MNILWIMLVAAALLALAGRFYAPIIGRVLGERADRMTPAVRINDGRDYVPTQTPVVFAHHYASIAGAGPIIGPIIAIYYGWVPALLWIVLGGIFLGAVHDYVSTHIAVREGGKNLAVVTRRYVGQSAFVMVLVLLVALLVLVCAAFLDLSAKALTSTVSVAALQLPPDQTLFRVDAAGNAIIGGIASTSVVVITVFSPLMGWLYLKRKTPVWACSLLAVAICLLSVLVGVYFPMAVQPKTWMYLISGYVLISAGLPVWMFLQSRDFINVHMLYLGMAFLILALLAAAVRGGGAFGAGDSIPWNNWAKASAQPSLGPGWPMLFVIIACGAVSGFHSLCAGGTTCKQLSNEPAARKVGFYGMLLESFLAVCVVCAVLVGLSMGNYEIYQYGGKPNAVLTFAMSVGHTAHIGFDFIPIAAGALGAMLLLEGFLVTTLDTAIRLTRYMIEEGWATFFGRFDVFADHGATDGPAESTGELVGTGGLTGERASIAYARDARVAGPTLATSGAFRAFLLVLKQYWVNSGIAVALMLLLAFSGGYEATWKIFGSSNQLLAALGLVIGTTWLMARHRPVWYTLLPAIFMLVTSITALVRKLVLDYIPNWNDKAPLAVTSIVVLVVTAGILVCTVRQWVRTVRPATVPA